jgi:hypothetical protein
VFDGEMLNFTGVRSVAERVFDSKTVLSFVSLFGENNDVGLPRSISNSLSVFAGVVMVGLGLIEVSVFGGGVIIDLGLMEV